MFQINLPPFKTNIIKQDDRIQIFDILRKRFVQLTPEEWVRQHFVHFLIEHKGYPSALMANEISLTLNKQWRRCDSVLFRRDNTPQMIIEYKAPSIKITQDVFTQIESYNQVLRVRYLIVTNGLSHYCCCMDYAQNKCTFLKEVPHYTELT